MRARFNKSSVKMFLLSNVFHDIRQFLNSKSWLEEQGLYSFIHHVAYWQELFYWFQKKHGRVTKNIIVRFIDVEYVLIKQCAGNRCPISEVDGSRQTSYRNDDPIENFYHEIVRIFYHLIENGNQKMTSISRFNTFKTNWAFQIFNSLHLNKSSPTHFSFTIHCNFQSGSTKAFNFQKIYEN